MGMVRMEGIRKTYLTSHGEVHALNGVDLTVEEGEFLAIMGRSGSGKSTLLNIIGTLQKPTAGSYFLRERQVDQMTEKEILELRRREIGFVFQQYRLLASYTIWENICMPLALDQMEVDEEYIQNLAERCGILEKLDAYPDQLSGGEQQRAALIRAMAHKPSIVIADEPTGNLDYRTGMEIMNLITECRLSFGQTILMVTHDNECASYADRVIAMEDGKIKN